MCADRDQNGVANSSSLCDTHLRNEQKISRMEESLERAKGGQEDSSSSSGLNDDDDDDDDELSATYQSLFDDRKFTSLEDFLAYCRDYYSFDLRDLIEKFSLDFLGVIKLINYIRSQVKQGHIFTSSQIRSIDVFMDDKYLTMVIQDDAVIYNMGDLLSENDEVVVEQVSPKHRGSGENKEMTCNELKDRLNVLEREYKNYRKFVEETLENRWQSIHDDTEQIAKETAALQDEESLYFDSYNFTDIHETMLKDSVRTNAYRDFIYDNKGLFENKVVLDVGCGTGILSMFCAKAGASHVYAVDNSPILAKAREIIFTNSFHDTITCIHGKIEEIELPVDQVDIIVSEWMGYALLYEAMLDSVLFARDRYLIPHGLMIPSHAVLHVAAMCDKEYYNDHINFWNDVYAFDMTPMKEKLHDSVILKDCKIEDVVSNSCAFVEFDLKCVTKHDLTFTRPFRVKTNQDIDCLCGWFIWFDIFFLASSSSSPSYYSLPHDLTAKSFMDQSKGIAFTTGPSNENGCTSTHWQTAVLFRNFGINYGKKLPCNTQLSGTISYERINRNERGLRINISWYDDTKQINSKEQGQQSWVLC